MAWSEDPPRSFKFLIAVQTMSEVGGWVGFVLGFFAFFGEEEETVFFLEGAEGEPETAAWAAGTDEADVVSPAGVSAILLILYTEFRTTKIIQLMHGRNNEIV